MKAKSILLLSVLFFLLSCQSKEEQIERLIEDALFRSLFDFSSYEPIETKIDSAFSSIYRDTLIISYAYLVQKELEDIDNYLRNIDRAQSTMEIYFDSRSSSGRLRYNRANQEVEENLSKARESLSIINDYYDLIRERAETFQNDFIGWQAIHRYRTKTRGGHFDIGDNLYIIDPDLEKIIYQESLDDEELRSLRNLIDEALEQD